MLTVWGRKTSSNVQALMWCIGELGLAYARHDAGHRYGGTDTPEFLAMNPNGTVPVVKDGDGEPLWETGAILRYLGNRYGRAPFWPEEVAAKTRIDMWAEWAKLNIALNFTVPIFWRVARTAPGEVHWPLVRDAVAVLANKLAIAEPRLASGGFLCGEQLTLADIQFGHVLYRYFAIPIERPQLPNLRRYYEQLTVRAAFREHVMVSYAELAVA
jgi:glutathione S-transferase